MKTLFLILIFFSTQIFGQDTTRTIQMISDRSSDNAELQDFFSFEGVYYYKVKFMDKNLGNKKFHITVKEVWDGKIVNDTTVFNSADIGIKQFETVNDTILNMRILSKVTKDNKLKMMFRFPSFSVTKEYKASNSSDKYSLRNIAEESDLEIRYNEKFYFLAYTLPYEREDGSKSWCEVGVNGKEIENWGEKFKLKHYLIFEMIFFD